MKELIKIQSELSAPKSAFNSFAKFHYRTAESILAAVKPFLKDLNCILNLKDEVVLIGDRYYVKATARLQSLNKAEVGIPSAIESVAYARESEILKGMDSAQITGAASSYARKYALNGLFAIDDERDPDTRPPVVVDKKEQKPAPKVVIAPKTGASLREGTPDWAYTVKRLTEGVKMEDIEKYFNVSKEQKVKLLTDMASTVLAADLKKV